MPLREADESDPNLLVGVLAPGSAESTLDMAYAFAEEFASMGHDAEAIEAIFANPGYGAPHGAWLALGADEVRRVIAECLGLWGRVRFVVEDGGEEPEALVQIGGLAHGPGR